jgi:hypothetical protein
MRGGDLPGGVATRADEPVGSEQRAGLRDGKAQRGKVDAVRSGGARHVDAVVDQEGRGSGPADGEQASRQVEKLGGGKVLLAELDRGDARRQARKRRPHGGDQVRNEAAIGHEVEADHLPTMPVTGLEALP